MTKSFTNPLFFIFLMLMFCGAYSIAQTAVGYGSYTTVYPGADAAGRNGFPSGSPQLSKTAVGLSGLNASKVTVSDYSDWTVSMNWNDGVRDLEVTSGIGMPFLYFEKNSAAVASVNVNSGTASISNELLIIENASSGADFVVYAPTGSTWSVSGSTYTSTLNGKNYWSMAMLPQSTSNVASTAQAYKKYAYVFPTNTTTSWDYNLATAKVTTDFSVTTHVKEGTNTNVLMGLLPNQIRPENRGYRK